jgi:hypothetical protein
MFMKTTSRLFSLEDIVCKDPFWVFTIPLYQRPYVWGDEQIRVLLEDIRRAFEDDDDVLFLGNILLIEREADSVQTGRESVRCFEVVDGQQRLTTLWLLCHVWRHDLEGFLRVNAAGGTILRLTFAIRDDIKRFFESLSQQADKTEFSDKEVVGRMLGVIDRAKAIAPDPGLGEVGAACAKTRRRLAEYVFRRVKFVVTVVPQQTDLNKLFEVINSRGEQLQHHEILKARMLAGLPDPERASYGAVWDMCADMDSYWEDVLAKRTAQTKEKIAELCDGNLFLSAPAVRELLGKSGEGRGALRSLKEILVNADGCPSDVRANETSGERSRSRGESENDEQVQSILDFPRFLLHVLRIWLWERGKPDLQHVADRKLLALFGEHFFPDKPPEDDIRSFIDLLWRLRVLWDQYFIKRVTQEKGAHLIKKLSSHKNRALALDRMEEPEAYRPLSLLQSMLYHSQDITTQYWVTPLLGYLHQNDEAGTMAVFEYLRRLDNSLFGTSDGRTLAQRTRAIMDNVWPCVELALEKTIAPEEPLGVAFPHYWFYKLEFVLWYEWWLGDRKGEPTGKDYRMTAKNSVEHISPRTPQETDTNRVAKALDCFGNLALVSRSINSEYGNLPFTEKKARFINRNQGRVDSLKMALIYQHTEWNDDLAFAHQNDMIRRLQAYYEIDARI